jgi:hypothetical protein
MYFRPALLTIYAAVLIAAGAGCQKSEPPAPPAPPTVLSPDTTAHVHWLGKKRLGITAGAYYFTRIWQFPQGAKLERQTLTKLATAPGQWLPGGTNLTADAVPRLWLVLNDLVQEESYLEIRVPTNSQPSSLPAGAAGRAEPGSNHKAPTSIVFAIRLSDSQSESWRTNLPALLQPLTGASVVNNPIDHTWAIQTTNVLNDIQFMRVDHWTLVSAGPAQNTLKSEIADRIRRDGIPFVSSGTNLWLEVGLDLPRLREIFSLSAGGEGRGEVGLFPALNSQLSTLDHLNLAVSGDGGTVITRGRVDFAKPFVTPLQPWRLPVELMHEPLTSFTAVRGVQSWLTAFKPWQELQIAPAPDQLFAWSLAGNAYQMYLAAPLPDARASVAGLSDYLLQTANPWLATNGYISFDRAADGNGITWGNLPDIKPFIRAADSGNSGFLLAGLFPDTNNAAAPPPAGLIQDVLRRTNLVYYDWEVTGPRVQPVLMLGQTARQIARRPEMALDSAAMTWLASLIPRLGTTITLVNRTGPAELSFYRRSTLGLNAVELHLFTDWLESPQFPYGLHSSR